MKKSESTLKLAVIGGGPSAAAVLEAILQHLASEVNVDITVFDPSPNLWCGYAFQPDGNEVLSNVSMGIMSVRPNDREHGMRWLKENGYDQYCSQTAFPPRSVVGEYLKKSAEKAISELFAAGSSVLVEKSTVTGLEQRQERLWVNGQGWTRGPFDHAIMCPGTSKSYDPYKLSGTAGYIGAPYPLRASLASVPPDARIAIIGSGLTAVDTVMALRERKHRGPITLVSRNGLLPGVRSAPALHEISHLTLAKIADLVAQNGFVRISDVVALAETELIQAGVNLEEIKIALTETMSAEPQLRKDIKSALTLDPGWAILRSGLIGIGQHAWYFLTDEDKVLLRAANHKLMRFLCPMPLRTAQRLLEMFETKQLEVIGSVKSVQPATGDSPGFEIHAQRDLACDLVIEASTPATREISGGVRTLIDSLIRHGLAVANPFGGLEVDIESSRVLNRLGISNPRIHALGDLTSGTYFFIFGLSAQVGRADGIVRDIASFLKETEWLLKQNANDSVLEL